ncbi:hypothetical protein BKA70DRAFT_1162581 [Coprinopsis sp. MPI-PUGE-AT-0042]|nr:hypothetical protein BKA70DRAFT_1162581 [Coprinopsis sp. MPI-PUGE-AT-0042]
MVTTDPTQGPPQPYEMRNRVPAPTTPGGNVNVLEPTTESNVSLLDMPGEMTTDPLHIPANLENAQFRMDFPVSYVFVGVYRLFTDPSLWQPAWEKCRNGTRRGLIVGAVWVALTFGIQKRFVEVFLRNSPRITGLSNDTVLGYKIPMGLHTYATLLYASHQLTSILYFFLSKNIRIARDRAYDYTVASRMRNKDDDFWKPYVEEFEVVPKVNVQARMKKQNRWYRSKIGMIVIRQVLTIPAGFYPLIVPLGLAWTKALGTAETLHRRYFEAKKMTDQQVAIFMEERKWSYRAFGFIAALLEGLPLVGPVFTISNRVGAAMWAFDLEKRQHWVAERRARGETLFSGRR